MLMTCIVGVSIKCYFLIQMDDQDLLKCTFKISYLEFYLFSLKSRNIILMVAVYKTQQINLKFLSQIVHVKLTMFIKISKWNKDIMQNYFTMKKWYKILTSVDRKYSAFQNRVLMQCMPQNSAKCCSNSQNQFIHQVSSNSNMHHLKLILFNIPKTNNQVYNNRVYQKQ